MSRQLFRRTTLVSANTFFSRILGFVRDIVVAHYFGASVGADAFFVAFRIPNFMRALFAEGAFSQAFIPVLAKYRQTKSHEDTRVFIDRVTGDLAAVLTIVAVLGVIFASFVITIFAPGFLKDPVRFVLATHMLRVMFPYVLLISVTALCSGILNTYDSFGVPAFTPVLLNIILIVMAIFAASHFATPIYALAWGVLIAGVAQVLFQLPFLFHKRVLPRLSISFKDPGVRRVLKLMAPAIVGVSVVQLSLLLDTLFASFLPVGSVSWLYYSSRLMNFPLGVFGVAIATVILPKLARQHNAKDHASFSGTLDWGLRVLLLIAVPSTVGLWILSGPLLATLFKTGRFDVNDVLMTQQSLIAFSSGIAAFMLIKVLASAFYAKQDIATPVRIAVAAV
ncbi:MAG TPA: murein biosynthesis integral membrane protein MurJ, partial [Gammaproteobacteria bacterium]|nr:murein biosynthesis integral membrane protein MurJ [Gammaproteobacteria bacterium]